MLRKLFLFPVLAMLALPVLAQAQFEAGNWSLELSGSGGNGQDFDGGSAAVNFELSYFTTKELAVGVRQSVIWSDLGPGSTLDGSTRLLVNYHFDLDRWQPYVGASIGYSYGDIGDDAWIAGPEVGVKYFVNNTTYVDLVASYDFNLEDGLDEGSFNYGLGIGFRW